MKRTIRTEAKVSTAKKKEKTGWTKLKEGITSVESPKTTKTALQMFAQQNVRVHLSKQKRTKVNKLTALPLRFFILSRLLHFSWK